MSRAIYNVEDVESIKRVFKTLLVKNNGDVAATLSALDNNNIATVNAPDWETELSEVAELVKPWVEGEAVKIGMQRRHNDITYVVIQEHTTQADWEPQSVPALFLAKVAVVPGDDYPAWIQPTGAHDAYASGTRVTHNGINWENTINANVWEPGIFGWIILT